MKNKDLTLNVTQAAEIQRAARNAGYEPVDLKQLSSAKVLKKILPVLQGDADVVMKNHIIDLMADPFVPDGWKVAEHTKTEAQIEFDSKKIELYLSKSQKQGKVIKGHDLRKELEGKPVLNANVLDYLLAHPEIIPNSWKDEYIFFWGTIYRDSGDGLCVRFLHWYGDEWYWHCLWLDNDFGDGIPTALLTSI